MTVPMQREDLSMWVTTPDPWRCGPLRARTGSRLRADVVIVGAGFAGLSAAYHLTNAQPGLDVVVVDSSVPGAGASGRNTGILRPGVGGTILDLCSRFGEDAAYRLYAASVAAVEQVRTMICAEGIDCELEGIPHVKVARTSRQAAKLRKEAATLERLGFAAEYSDNPDVPVPSYGGLCFPESGQLNPALLVRGLTRIVRERGVRVYAETPVVSIQPGRPVRLTLGNRVVLVADRVVLATNAHTPGIGLLRGQVIPLQTHLGVTEPLTAEQLGRLDWATRNSFSDKRHVFDYYRLTRDNRLMFGGGRPVYRASRRSWTAGSTDLADPRVWRTQLAVAAQAFPALTDVTVARQWAGTVGMTLDQFPVMAEVAPGVVFAGGWSGHGVHLATASGALVADLVLGQANPLAALPWARAKAPWVPPDPARAVGLRTYVRALQWADRVEALVDRKPRTREEQSCQPVLREAMAST